jgi:hypothetical protein
MCFLMSFLVRGRELALPPGFGLLLAGCVCVLSESAGLLLSAVLIVTMRIISTFVRSHMLPFFVHEGLVL